MYASYQNNLPYNHIHISNRKVKRYAQLTGLYLTTLKKMLNTYYTTQLARLIQRREQSRGSNSNADKMDQT